RFEPRFNVQVGRDEWWKRRPICESNTGDVAAKEIVFPGVDVVVTSVAGCFDGLDLERRNTNAMAIVQEAKISFGNRRDPTPKSLHVVAEKPLGRSDELGRINQVRCAPRMDVDNRAKLRETPCGTGMVEMNVAEKNVANVCGRKADPTQLGCNGIKGRLRAGVEQRQPVLGFERSGGHDAAGTELVGVEDVNHRRRVSPFD